MRYHGAYVGFPKIRGTILGVPVRRTIDSILGSILGFPYFGKLPHRHTVLIRAIWRAGLGSAEVTPLPAITTVTFFVATCILCLISQVLHKPKDFIPRQYGSLKEVMQH